MAWTDVSVCYGHPAVAPEISDATLLKAMDAAGVGVAWIFGYNAVATHDFVAENDRVAKLVKAHPDRFVPVGLVNPFEAFPEVDRVLDKGFLGIKILSGWGNWLTIENVRRLIIPIAERLQERSCHMSVALEGNVPTRGGRVYLPLLIRESCPDVSLVLDRCWSPTAWEDYLTIAREDPSLWVTLHWLPQRLMERIVDELGTRRVLLGTWYPETDADLAYAPLERAAALGSKIDAILSNNAERVLQALPPLVTGH